MRKFAFICLILPSLSFGASTLKSAKSQVTLKAATMVDADKKFCGGTYNKGRCYIFDEKVPKLVLEGVRYQVNPQNELIVDLKVSPKDQEKLSKISKDFVGKRYLVIMVNDKIISAPFLKSHISGQDFQISLKQKSDVQKLLSALGG